MKIEDVLKNEDKAIPVYQERNRFSNVYASLDDGGVLWWHSMKSDERLEPVPLAAINEKEWGAYHEEKEIRPEKAGELWNNQQSYSFTTWNPKDGLCITTKVGIQVSFKGCASRFDMVHGRNGWKLIYSPDKEVMAKINREDENEIEQGKSALAWVRKQAQEFDPSVDDDESASICSRVISNAIPFEDDDVERIEIEGVEFTNLVRNESGLIKCKGIDKIIERLERKPPMKMILEIPKI